MSTGIKPTKLSTVNNSVSFTDIIKGTFVVAVFYRLLNFIKNINLYSVFAYNGKIAEAPKPKKKLSKKKTSKQNQQKALFPTAINVDQSLKDCSSVTPCSTSFGAFFVAVKSEEGEINWNLADADETPNSQNGDFFKKEDKEGNVRE